MTRSILFLTLLLWAIPALAKSRIYWIAGDDFIGKMEFNAPTFFLPMHPKSVSLDRTSCDLYVGDEHETLFRFAARGSKPEPLQSKGFLLEEEFQTTYYARNTKNQLEERNKEGSVLQTLLAIPKTSRSFKRGLQKNYILDYRDNQLDLLVLSKNSGSSTTVSLSHGSELWSEPKLTLDTKGTPWVGYTSRTVSHMYAPVLKHFDAAGKTLQTTEWPDRGIFFDLCAEENGSVTISRDIPTSNFTVPVYSFLENIVPGSKPIQQYEAETNFFIDSMVCTPNTVWMIQRSIFGSEGSHVQEWERGNKDTGKTLFKLPGRAWKIQVCDVG